MRSDARTILFVREIPWESFFPISTRMLAGEFARDGWNVIWLNPPLMPWHNDDNKSHYQQLLAQNKGGGIFYGGSVFAYTPRSYVPFSRRPPLDRPFLARWMWRGCWPPVRRVLDNAGVPEPDVLWLANLHGGGVKDLFPGCPTIFHVTDDYEHFPSTPVTCMQIERANYAVADHIVVTAPTLKTMLQSRFGVSEDKISVIMQGVHLDRFVGDHFLPDGLSNCPTPRIVALGNTKWLDYEVLATLANAFSQGSIIVLGPTCRELEDLASVHSNVFALGGITPELVPAYLMASDVGLVLFGEQVQEVAQGVCPMKLFEYAAAGLPVVSTPLPVLHKLDVPVWQVDTLQAAVQAVKEALAEKVRLAGVMRAFARRHTWQQRYQKAKSIVESLL